MTSAAARPFGGDYDLISPVGHHVWQATRRRDDLPVAIRLLSFGGESRKALQRAEAARQAFGALFHPTLVPVFDVIVDGDQIAMVTELVHGRTLASALATGGLNWATAAAIGERIATGLSQIHRAELAHGLVCADAIILDDSAGGAARLGELATLRLAEDPASLPDSLAKGMVASLAPELGGIGEPTPASDVFALGSVIHQLLEAKATSSSDMHGLGEPAGSVLSWLLQKRPEARAAADHAAKMFAQANSSADSTAPRPALQKRVVPVRNTPRADVPRPPAAPPIAPRPPGPLPPTPRLSPERRQPSPADETMFRPAARAGVGTRTRSERPTIRRHPIPSPNSAAPGPTVEKRKRGFLVRMVVVFRRLRRPGQSQSAHIRSERPDTATAGPPSAVETGRSIAYPSGTPALPPPPAPRKGRDTIWVAKPPPPPPARDVS